MTPLAQELLLQLARSPGKEFYVRELAKLTGRSPAGCQQALRELARKGLLGKRTSGRNLYYSVRYDNPAVKHFKIFTSILELEGVVKSIKSLSTEVILFGSCSTGEDTWDSDIDLVVVTNDVVGTRKTLKSFELNRDLRPVLMTPVDLFKLKGSSRSYYDEIEKGIVLRMGEDGEEPV